MKLATNFLTGVLFLISWAAVCFAVALLFNLKQDIFPLTMNILLYIYVTVSLVLINSLLFIIFAILPSKWFVVFVPVVTSAIMPSIFISGLVAYILSVGYLTVVIVSYLMIKYKLSSYIDFNPAVILSSIIMNFSLLIIFIVSVSYFTFISATESTKTNFNSFLNDVSGFSLDKYIDDFAKTDQKIKKVDKAVLANNLIDVSISRYFESVGSTPVILSSLLFMIMLVVLVIESFFIAPIVKGLFSVLDAFGVIKIMKETDNVHKFALPREDLLGG